MLEFLVNVPIITATSMLFFVVCKGRIQVTMWWCFYHNFCCKCTMMMKRMVKERNKTLQILNYNYYRRAWRNVKKGMKIATPLFLVDAAVFHTVPNGVQILTYPLLYRNYDCTIKFVARSNFFLAVESYKKCRNDKIIFQTPCFTFLQNNHMMLQ